MLKVEVCYALPDKQEIVAVKLPAGATLQQALEASGLLAKFLFGGYCKFPGPWLVVDGFARPTVDDFMQELAYFGNTFDFLSNGGAPAMKFLTERHWHGILKMRSSHLQNLIKLSCFSEERQLQQPE